MRWHAQWQDDAGKRQPLIVVEADSADMARDLYIEVTWPDMWSAHHLLLEGEAMPLPAYLDVWEHIRVRPELTLVRGGKA